jgi:hypothetical protein
MANIDPELQRLEESVRVARERVTLVIQQVADPAAIKAATDLVQKQSQPSARP